MAKLFCNTHKLHSQMRQQNIIPYTHPQPIYHSLQNISITSTHPRVQLFTCPHVHMSARPHVRRSTRPHVHTSTCTCPQVHKSRRPQVHTSTRPQVHTSSSLHFLLSTGSSLLNFKTLLLFLSHHLALRWPLFICI